MNRKTDKDRTETPATHAAEIVREYGPFRADLSARSAAGVEELRLVGLEPADAGAARRLQPLEHRAALRKGGGK